MSTHVEEMHRVYVSLCVCVGVRVGVCVGVCVVFVSLTDPLRQVSGHVLGRSSGLAHQGGLVWAQAPLTLATSSAALVCMWQQLQAVDFYFFESTRYQI